MTTEWLEKGNVGGDVFIREDGSPEYTRESKSVTNAGETTLVLDAGYPFDDNVPELVAGVAGIDGVLSESVRIAPGETLKVSVIQRGEVVLNRDALPTHDYAGDAFDMDTLQTQLETLGFIVRREPTQTDTQTT